jgi:hypothetical protein
MTHVDRLLASLFPPAAERAPAVHAVLDGARDERIHRAVYDSRLDYECLFAGELSYDLMLAAPYLVRLTPEASFTRWLLEEGWGKSFGVFAWSFADLETLRRHFRRILQVRDEAGQKLFFRFYDPRVIRTYVPTATVAEMREVLGPLTRLITEGDRGQVLFCEPGGAPGLREAKLD